VATAVETRWSVEAIAFDVTTFLSISVVRGRFARVDGFYEAGPAGARLELLADARSVETGDPARDGRLRSLSGVDLDAYPTVRLSSTSVRQGGDGSLHVDARLEAMGKVRPVRFDARLRRTEAGLELDGSWKVAEPLSATVHVTVRLRDAG